MVPREELVASAVNFLQDPSTASSPVEKRIEFLKSKNLTQEEIDIALARAQDEQARQQPQLQQSPYYPPAQQYRGPPPPGYGYPQYPYHGWGQPPPQELPRRDWRDWFIMATVAGGATFGLWTLTQRYIKPLIAPPTPAQLEQDKAEIDEQFNRAFALLDTLSADTTALKEAEEARTRRLDGVISDVESIVAELKSANAKREDESRRMESEIKNIRESLPKAIDNVRDGSEKQLKELSSELGSLKMLLSNRIGGTNTSFSPAQGASRASFDPSNSKTAATTTTDTNSATANGVSKMSPYSTTQASYSSSSIPTTNSMSRSSSTTLFGSAGGKPAIPAWQMAASKNKDFQATATATTDAASADGADAVAALNSS